MVEKKIIFVRVRTGSWPDGCRAQFAARTASISIQLLKKQKLEKHSLLNMTRLALKKTKYNLSFG